MKVPYELHDQYVMGRDCLFSLTVGEFRKLLKSHETAMLEKIIEIDKLKAEIRRMRPAVERDSWAQNPDRMGS